MKTAVTWFGPFLLACGFLHNPMISTIPTHKTLLSNIACTPAPYAILRFGGMPFRNLLHLRLDKTVTLLHAARQRQAWFDQHRDELSDQLYQAVGTTDDKYARRHLLDIRRSLPANKMPKGGLQTIHAVRHHVAPQTRLAMLTWFRRVGQSQRQQKAISDAFTQELPQARCALRDLLQQERFRKGALLTSKNYYEGLDQYLRKGIKRSASIPKIEISSALYLARMAAKTSPFSTLTPTALGKFDPENEQTGLIHLTEDIYSVVRINTAVIHIIARQLSLLPEIRTTLPVRLRDGVWVEDGRLHYLHAEYVFSRNDMFAQLEQTPLLNKIVKAVSGSDVTYEMLWMKLSGGNVALREKACQIIDHFIQQGLLVCTIPISPHDSDPLASLVQFLEGYETACVQAVRQRLLEIGSEVKGYETAVMNGRQRALSHIRQGLRAIAQQIGLPHETVLLSNPIFENCSPKGISFSCGRAIWEEIQQSLLPLLQTIDPRKTGQSPAMVRFFLEQYTAEGECDNFLYFLKQYTQWQQQIAVRSQAAMSDLAPTIYNSEVVVQTLAKQAFEQWQAAGQQDNVVHLAPIVPAENLTDMNGWATSCSLFVQIAATSEAAMNKGDYLIILDRCINGWGAYTTRYIGMYDTADEPSPLLKMMRQHFDQVNHHGEFVGMPVFSDVSNLQAHPPLTARTLTLPVEPTPKENIPLFSSQVAVRYDGQTNQLQLIDKETNRPIIPLYTGGMYSPSMPALMQAVVHEFTPVFYPMNKSFWNHLLSPTFADADQHLLDLTEEIIHLPRVQIGRVVLDREQWLIAIEAIPQRQSGETINEFFQRLYHWKEEVGLPDIVFAKISTTHKSMDIILKHQYKPFLVDFCNPWLVMALQRMLSDDVKAIVFSEMLPGLNELTTRVNNEPVVGELQLELTWQDRP